MLQLICGLFRSDCGQKSEMLQSLQAMWVWVWSLEFGQQLQPTAACIELGQNNEQQAEQKQALHYARTAGIGPKAT